LRRSLISPGHTNLSEADTMAGKGGGAWKVAYADFVTAMMAFFLVMWITAQNKETKVAIAQYFENPLGSVEGARATSVLGIEGASADAPIAGNQAGRHGTNRDGVAEEDSGAAQRSKKTAPPIRIFEKLDKTRSVGTMLVFDEHSATVTAEGRAQLLTLVPQLLGKPNKIEIRGHAARYPLPAGSKFASAWELCFARCLATRDLLVEHGISADRIRLSQDGDSDPYGGDSRDPELRQLSSRVEVFAVSEFVYDHKASHLDRFGRFVEPTETDGEDAALDPEVDPNSDPAGEAGSGHSSDAGHAKPASSHSSSHAPKPAAGAKSGGHGHAPQPKPPGKTEGARATHQH
jgi:chemotaxis protein MotB